MDIIADFNVLCTKAEGRDKVARLFQYIARAIVGFAGMAKPKAGSSLSNLETNARMAMTQLAGARRTHRWCKEFPVIMGLPASLRIADPLDRVLELLQKVSLATFMCIDHVGHMKQWKLLSGGKRAGSGTIQLGLKFFCFSNFVGALVQGKKVASSLQGEDDKTKAQRRKSLETIMKHLLLVLQTAHLSRLYESHDALVGVAGVVTSWMDIIPHWPVKPATAAPAKAAHPDAKEKAK
mmetsp:Transcript_77337/g.202961  ORF Transcript_77337/g.202961 Transcript_77337/m.202961 type:complete len:237 (-) Transcript_77337:152-862(-)